MKNLPRSIVLLATITLSSCAHNRIADPRIEAIDDLFRSEGVVATFVAEAADGGTVFIYNDSRSSVRFSPASTFKIPNTLIALDTRAVASKASIFEWDGTDKGMQQWNQDHTLESAFRDRAARSQNPNRSIEFGMNFQAKPGVSELGKQMKCRYPRY